MPREVAPAEVAAFRQRFCEAAVALFEQGGFARLSLRKLGEATGMSAMTPYRYFASKAAILAALRALATDRLADRLERALDVPGCGHARARGVFAAYVDFALDEPAAYRLIFGFEPGPAEPCTEQEAATGRLHGVLTRAGQVLEDAEAEGSGAGGLGVLCWALAHGTASLYLARPSVMKGDDPRTIAAAGLEALLRGVRSTGHGD
ncbi:TetR/AcrR family transcriptional regulator [Caulobacter sp. KR2-114]|uniref:TetR/AcrR family transcriptional regulator n=1 Tax=Caulobacter sp. KR2-114 TaxID=3400912 RepID=UPI003C0E1467